MRVYVCLRACVHVMNQYGHEDHRILYNILAALIVWILTGQLTIAVVPCPEWDQVKSSNWPLVSGRQLVGHQQLLPAYRMMTKYHEEATGPSEPQQQQQQQARSKV